MAQNIDIINQICSDLSGTGGHTQNIDGINEICTLLGGTGGHTQSIDALNEICEIMGKSHAFTQNIDALNALCEGSFTQQDDAWSLIQSASLLNLIPTQADALFWLDGTPNGYLTALVDKINGWEFPLSAAYDWDFRYFAMKILPYSGVTFSPPANGTAAATAIQAVDVNNFWYAADGTANVIPFTSFWGDQDYEHICFARNVAQTTQAITAVQLTPAGVTDIVLYKTAKTGADLTACNTFYNVPIEDATALWVAKTGDDTTGDGTKALPYLTITKGLSTTKKTYVKSGVYVEDAALHCLTMGSVANVYALGLCDVRQTNQTYTIIVSGTGALLFQGFAIDSTGIATGIRHDSASRNKVFARCYFKGATTEQIRHEQNGATNCVYNDCAFKSTGTHIANMISGGTFNRCNFLSAISSTGFYESSVSYSGDVLNFNYCHFSGSATYHTYIVQATHFNVTVFNNTSKNLTGVLFWFSAQRNFDCQKNLLAVENNTAIRYTPDATLRTCNVIDNFVSTKSLTGYGIGIGSEGSATSNDMATTVITGNTILGPIYHNPAIDLTTVLIHGLFVGHLADTVQKYNYVNGCCIGTGRKHTGAAIASGKGIYYNLLVNNVWGTGAQGTNGCEIYNNTIYNNLTGAVYAVRMLKMPTGEAAINTKVKNNIIHHTQEATAFALIYCDAESSEGLDSDYNTIRGINKYGYINGTLYNNLAEWQAVGQDVHSVNTDPALSLSFVPSTPLTGLSLDAAFDDGLDILTNWGSLTAIPVITTKQQGEAWQKGAFVQ